MALYESEITRFLRDFLEKHPEQVEEQRKGRALWWDKPQTPETLRRDRESRVPEKAYSYQSNGR
ncbi:MAG: DUF3460 family protein [Betaproteobacteria bacterium]|nr:DUF3460 family protein [Betaproteobacteria bacterium]